jgi:hypothetical protein
MSQTSPETETLRRRFEAASRAVSNGSGGDIRRFYECASEKDLRAAYEAICGHAQTPDLEATVSRVMRIRNGMIPDGDAEALVRKEIGALSQSSPNLGVCLDCDVNDGDEHSPRQMTKALAIRLAHYEELLAKVRADSALSETRRSALIVGIEAAVDATKLFASDIDRIALSDTSTDGEGK